MEIKSSLKIALFTMVVIAFLFLLKTTDISATLDNQDNQNEAAITNSYPFAAKGQIIVKYKDTVSVCVHCLIREGRDIAKEVRGDGRNLDELHSRYGVFAAEPVFRTIEEEKRVFRSAAEIPVEALRQYQRSKLDVHKLKYARIASRAPASSVLPDLHHVYVLQIAQNADVSGAVEEFSKDPNVEYAQPNYFVQADLNPNDTYYRSSGSWGQKYDDLWSLKQNQVNLAPAWDLTQGEGIVVGVVDTGLDYNHPDIANNVWANPSETQGNNIDDDKNGFVDDHRGWDFTTCTEFANSGCATTKPEDNDPIDENFHGTHVSGTIAAVGGNKRGIIGVAPKAKIMPVRALNQNGQGQNSDLAPAIVYAAANGADVINNSWSCGFCPKNPLIEEAVETAYKLGSVVVFSSGNQSINVRAKSPQNMHVFKPIIVGATNQKDQPVFFSNFGSTVDVGAPGGGVGRRDVNILSLAPASCNQCPNRYTLDDQYLRLQGTSMSAPHVSGLAALLLSQRPSLKNEEVRQIIRSSAKDVGPQGFDFDTGAGRIYAPDALDRSVPIRVSIDRPSHLFGAAPVSVPIKGSVAGSGISGYQLSYFPENGTSWIPIGTPRSGAINNGLLGNFPGNALPLGWHSVKLEAMTLNGKRYEDVIDLALTLPSKRIRSRRNMAHDPDISGDLVVFAEDVTEGETAHLVVYNLKTKKRIRITDHPVDSPYPRISGSVITWFIDRDHHQDGIYYCVLNQQTGKCPVKQLSSNMYTDLPSVSGKYITWSEETNGKEEIYLYDISKDKKQVIGEGLHADIDGTDVIWLYIYPGRTRADLFHYDIRNGKTTQLTHNPRANEFYPRISGRKIAFTRNHVLKGKPPHFDLYLYDLDTGKESKLVEDPEGTSQIDFSDHSVVFRHTFFEVHAYDLETGLIQRLSFYPVGVRSRPAVSGNTAIWILRGLARQDNGSVYYTTLR